MFKNVASRPWVCSRCIRRQSKLWRSYATAASQYHQPRPVPINNIAPGAQYDDRTLRQIFDSPNFWKDFSQSSKYGYPRKGRGLFQNRYLTEPKGFEVFANTSLWKAKRIVERVLAASSVEEYKHIVRDLDRLSDLLCRVIDLSDFVRATHPDYKIQAAATNAYAMMFEYMNVLNTTKGLDAQLHIAMNTPEVAESWSEEERVVVNILAKDFAKSAVDLPRAQRERFVNLSQDISEIGPEFVDHMKAAQPTVTFPSSKLKGMDPTLVREFTRWGQVSLPSLGGVSMAALRTVQDEGARQEIFLASRTASGTTLDRLDQMLKKRAELAKLSKFESYGHLTLSDKMAKSPESVNRFLQALSSDNSSKVKVEMAELLKAKFSNPDTITSILQPWDRDYYTHQVLSRVRSKTRSPDFISSFFSLGTVMQGLSRLFTRLYGVRFVPHESTPGETWNPDVRRLDVMSEADGHVAVLYCDLFSRSGKSPNPAHFTLRCSREIKNHELEEAALTPNALFTSIEESVNDGMAVSTASGVLKQLPTIALICDFSTHSNPSMPPSLLSFNEVTTLFHEMGHAIHSILGRTSLQNVSGTRCATDFAELPSVLMEHFAADPSVLALFARHYENDQPLPYEMVADKLILERKFEGSDIENQILLSMTDQAFHSTLPLERSFNTTHIYHEIQRKHGVLPSDPPGTSWEGFFGHLFGYGSTYYSYLFDRVLAKRIWQVVFASGHGGMSIDRANGEKMKEKVLKWGGGRDPWRCVSEVLDDGRMENGDEKSMGIVGSWGIQRR
ncbi:mitochondrial intermediate peptidase [Calycina marina]|uniref:Mitochondrial intermediate peptidase n=1 Tax=Calycina marina TaxID=1763456 RepID=A0A9P8CHI9_9HELO|nr:mitochondrial intermediate peptidase [Calycina marina]